MKRHVPITGKVACMLIVLAFAWGCGDQPDTARKPKVVRKKIAVAAKPSTTARQKPSRPVGGKASAPRPKSDIARAKPGGSAQAKPAGSSGQGAVASQKGLQPKSDIARQPVPAKSAEALPQKPGRSVSQQAGTAALPAAGSVETTLRPKSDSSEGRPGPAAVVAQKDSDEKKPAAKQPPAGEQKTAAQQKTGGEKTAGAKPNAVAKKKGPRPAYDPTGRTDPFTPLFQEKPVLPKKKTRTRIPRTPLEKIALGQLKLTAIILAPSGNRALVQEASGKGYVIRNGTYIGLDGGKVVDIERGRVIIEEEVEDIVGKLTKRKQELKLAKPVGEK